MRNVIDKLKNIDTKLLVAAGICLAAIVLFVIFWVIGNGEHTDSDKKNPNTQVNTEKNTESDYVSDSSVQESEKTEIEKESETEETTQIDTQETVSSELTTDKESEDNQENMNQDTTSPSTSETPNASETPNTSETPNAPETPNTPTSPNTPEAPSTPSTPSDSQTPPSSSEEESEKEDTSTKKEYTVKVYSVGGQKMYNVKVNVYSDKTLTNLVGTATTNANGQATLQLEPNQDYRIALEKVPEGYNLKPSYSFSGKTALIILESSIITGKAFPNKQLKVGDVMYDFTVPSAKGGEIKLSDVLKNKDLVVLNFWYVHCEFCVKEFPALENAYMQFADRAEVIALTPFDTMDAVKDFLVETPLCFQVATCDISVPNLFGVSSYPVSVFIDKYGVIREIERGAILEENGFVSIFEKYL